MVRWLQAAASADRAGAGGWQTIEFDEFVAIMTEKTSGVVEAGGGEALTPVPPTGGRSRVDEALFLETVAVTSWRLLLLLVLLPSLTAPEVARLRSCMCGGIWCFMKGSGLRL